MEKNDFIEKIIGGVFAIAAIVAAIIEVILGGCSAEAIVGGAKDVFGTLVVVVLFFAVAKEIVPKRKFEDRLRIALEAWQRENGNMIVRDPATDIEHEGGSPSCYSLNLKTNVVDFYENTAMTKKKGLFVRMPLLTRENYNQEHVTLKFFLNKGTFFSDLPKGEDTADKYAKLITHFAKLINAKHNGFAVANATAGKDKEITVTLCNPITTNADIKKLVELINTMYTAYLVAANLEK